MTNEQNIDMAKAIKRLELIKSLISLEEESEINAQILKLEQMALTSDLKYIIAMLKEKSYSKAVNEITILIHQHNQVIIFTDVELEGLKLEAKALEAEVSQLSDEKIELEKLIYEFGVRHNNELGELILKILQFNKSKSKGTTKEAEAEKNYNDYSEEFKISKGEKINELTEVEQGEMKQKYRKASKLCHPDVVSAEQKELADKLFAELNAAYNRNDLQKVIEILKNLEEGNFFVNKSDAINEKQLLKTEIERLRMHIKDLKKQVMVIKESDAFITISNISNWDTYFKESREKLAEQIKAFENAR